MRHQVPPGHRGFAKTMRRNATDAEKKLWSILRGKRLEGLKFKRQQPIAGYIADFVCFEHKLLVEADGGQHSESKRDKERDAALSAAGYRTLRFWNNDILLNPEGVAATILAAVQRGA